MSRQDSGVELSGVVWDEVAASARALRPTSTYGVTSISEYKIGAEFLWVWGRNRNRRTTGGAQSGGRRLEVSRSSELGVRSWIGELEGVRAKP